MPFGDDIVDRRTAPPREATRAPSRSDQDPASGTRRISAGTEPSGSSASRSLRGFLPAASAQALGRGRQSRSVSGRRSKRRRAADPSLSSRIAKRCSSHCRATNVGSIHRCIWCTNPTTPDEPEEHILGEGLVGERPFASATPGVSRRRTPSWSSVTARSAATAMDGTAALTSTFRSSSDHEGLSQLGRHQDWQAGAGPDALTFRRAQLPCDALGRLLRLPRLGGLGSP